jgi:hypothetical protein
MWLYVPVASRTILEDKLNALNLEEQVLSEKLLERGQLSYAESEALRVVQADIAAFKNSSLHPIIRNIFSLILTIVNMAFTGYLVLRVFIHLLRYFFSSLFGDATASHLADFLALQENAKANRLGSFASLLQILVIMYMMTSAFAGFYNLPITHRIRPKIRGLSMEKLTLNVACVLLISSSFPVVARILEITSFDLIGDYSNTTYLSSSWFLYLYKFVFLVALTYRYVTFFNRSLHDIVVNFMAPILAKLRTHFAHHNTALNKTGILEITGAKRKNE